MRLARVVFYGACQAAGAFAAFYVFFLRTDDPASWLTRAARLRS